MTQASLASWKKRRSRTRSRSVLVCLAFTCLAGCANGAPSFDLFGAFFPAWLLCGAIGIAVASIARVVFVGSGLAHVLPFQLAVCTAIGTITAILAWLVGFGR
ncbi:MAG TPA: YtcA family lipoprotein [Xanthobacteraceae bacterium]|nr:YtcA family lipoprotein [Xanthobacteraceae bacterium]